MCTDGASSAWLTPANARRTGKPNPSKPRGALVTDTTGRLFAVPWSGASMTGRVSGSSTVTAGRAYLLGLGAQRRSCVPEPMPVQPVGGPRAFRAGDRAGSAEVLGEEREEAIPRVASGRLVVARGAVACEAVTGVRVDDHRVGVVGPHRVEVLRGDVLVVPAEEEEDRAMGLTELVGDVPAVERHRRVDVEV